jgi:broad specificity phosphatase PhoE
MPRWPAASPHALHLIRHAEVHNPDHVVYAALPGFGLSNRGRAQAAAAADRLAAFPVAAVISSPLDRAVETAEALAAPHGLRPQADDRLTEWRLSDRWAGVVWEDLPERFPGELEAYLADPAVLPFSPESLGAVADRVEAAAMDAWHAHGAAGHVVVVAHQDPIEAGRRRLTRRSLDGFNHHKPHHAAVVTLRPTADAAGPRFRETWVWTPAQQ